MTVLAGFVPALRATRVPPIAAVREGCRDRNGRSGSGLAAGLSCSGSPSALLAYAALGGHLGSGKSLLALAVGALLGLFSALPALRRARDGRWPASSACPASRLGGAAGRLATDNATRNPARTASTAAALMIGLALVTFVAVLGKGLHGSIDRALNEQVAADWVVTSQNGWSSFPRGRGRRRRERRRASRSRRASAPTAAGSARRNVTVNGVEPATIARVYHFEWKQGSDADARGARRPAARS